MPFHDYECQQGHVTEKFFKTISEGEKANYVICPDCTRELFEDFEKNEDGKWPEDRSIIAKKIPGAPLGFGLYGDPAGYDKPSATKRFTTKTASKLTGNDSSGG